MIISHSKKFIFIHGPKTAGSSIAISLMRYLSPGDIARGYENGIKYGVKPPDWNKSLLYLRPQDLFRKDPHAQAYRRYVWTQGVPSTHLTAKQTQDLVGKRIWKKYFTFTFERNPWDRMISYYFWINHHFRTRRKSELPSFKKFIEAMYKNDGGLLKENHLAGYSNLPYYTIDGEIAVDYVGKYENLTADLQFVYNHIGIPFDGWLPYDKKGIRPEKTTPEEMYDGESIQQMKRIFSKEISLFGYKPTFRN